MPISKNFTIVLLLSIILLLLYANITDIHVVRELQLFHSKQPECPFTNVMVGGKYVENKPENFAEVCKCDPACDLDCDACCQLPYNAQSGTDYHSKIFTSIEQIKNELEIFSKFDL